MLPTTDFQHVNQPARFSAREKPSKPKVLIEFQVPFLEYRLWESSVSEVEKRDNP